MKLNTLEVISYSPNPTDLTFILDCTKQEALEQTSGKSLILKAGDATIGIWEGFTVTGVVDTYSTSSDGSIKTYTRLMAARALEPDTASAILSIEKNLEFVKSQTAGFSSEISEAKQSVDDVQLQLNALAGIE